MRFPSGRFSLVRHQLFPRLTRGFELRCNRHPIGERDRTGSLELFLERSVIFLSHPFPSAPAAWLAVLPLLPSRQVFFPYPQILDSSEGRARSFAFPVLVSATAGGRD